MENLESSTESQPMSFQIGDATILTSPLNGPASLTTEEPSPIFQLHDSHSPPTTFDDGLSSVFDSVMTPFYRHSAFDLPIRGTAFPSERPRSAVSLPLSYERILANLHNDSRASTPSLTSELLVGLDELTGTSLDEYFPVTSFKNESTSTADLSIKSSVDPEMDDSTPSKFSLDSSEDTATAASTVSDSSNLSNKSTDSSEQDRQQVQSAVSLQLPLEEKKLSLLSLEKDVQPNVSGKQQIVIVVINKTVTPFSEPTSNGLPYSCSPSSVASTTMSTAASPSISTVEPSEVSSLPQSSDASSSATPKLSTGSSVHRRVSKKRKPHFPVLVRPESLSVATEPAVSVESFRLPTESSADEPLSSSPCVTKLPTETTIFSTSQRLLSSLNSKSPAKLSPIVVQSAPSDLVAALSDSLSVSKLTVEPSASDDVPQTSEISPDASPKETFLPVPAPSNETVTVSSPSSDSLSDITATSSITITSDTTAMELTSSTSRVGTATIGCCGGKGLLKGLLSAIVPQRAAAKKCQDKIRANVDEGSNDWLEVNKVSSYTTGGKERYYGTRPNKDASKLNKKRKSSDNRAAKELECLPVIKPKLAKTLIGQKIGQTVSNLFASSFAAAAGESSQQQEKETIASEPSLVVTPPKKRYRPAMMQSNVPEGQFDD